MDKDKLFWLRLIRSEKVGPITFWQLLNRYETAEEALNALSTLIKQGNHKHRVG